MDIVHRVIEGLIDDGFRSGKGYLDQTFKLKHNWWKREREKVKDICWFMDLENAYDRPMAGAENVWC